jgi:predicted nucleic acid-binding Zn ribbon protein
MKISEVPSNRHCKVCGKLLVRRVWKHSDPEPPCTFLVRGTCSRRCAFVLVKQERDAARPARLCEFCVDRAVSFSIRSLALARLLLWPVRSTVPGSASI